ncbi:peptidase [Legionella impletisoli]|uniref:Peptidase n=2 Tax=Legionella impletisoli TaxID=343510 RepID=A0A917JM91_9GAMM|nr:peptidase [Legionella impletisoli]
MTCYTDDQLWKIYSVSTGKNGMGEQKNSFCTPRGWHRVHNIIGLEHSENSVFVAREWTGEIYCPELSLAHPNRDWILTRIIQLDGLEPGRNKGGEVDSLERYIYMHGTPDSTKLGKPGSKGCIRMKNKDIIQLASWIKMDARVYIE